MAQFNAMRNRFGGVWLIDNVYGTLGAIEEDGTIHIAPGTPCEHVDDVMKHEWVHRLQFRIYGSSAAAVDALNSNGYGGYEKDADCGAKQLGATWTYYTSTCTPQMNLAATAMLRGVRAPNT